MLQILPKLIIKQNGTFAVYANGRRVGTIEGLARSSELTILQRAFHRCHALQSGIALPGILMVLIKFLNVYPDLTDEKVLAATSGNLCRYVDYTNIVAAVRMASEEMEQGAG